MNRTALALSADEFDDVVPSRYQETQVFRRIPNQSVQPTLATASETPTQDAYESRNFHEIRPIPKARSNVFARTFHLLQQWEGQVTEVLADSFVAVVSDKANSENADEEVELDLTEVDPSDMYLLRPGSLFYWSVGYEDGRGIPRQRVSRIRFRRLPGLTTRDIARAKENAKKFATLFK
jgi:hypothetical protein